MNSFYDYKTIAEVLNAELDQRKRRNKSYSLRAFARDLEMSASRLSEVLKGSQGLSEKSAARIAEKLKLKSYEKKFWFDLVLADYSRNSAVRELAKKRLVEARKVGSVQEIKENQFRLIADWYHAAIVELLQVTGFKNDLDWIANYLGISVKDADEAIQRLLKLGLLKADENGHWQAYPEVYQTFSDVPSLAIRKFHQRILENGLESLHNDPMADREIQSMIVAIPREKLVDFRREMQSFLVQFWEKIDGSPKDQLYSFSLQLAPVRNRKTK